MMPSTETSHSYVDRVQEEKESRITVENETLSDDIVCDKVILSLDNNVNKNIDNKSDNKNEHNILEVSELNSLFSI